MDPIELSLEQELQLRHYELIAEKASREDLAALLLECVRLLFLTQTANRNLIKDNLNLINCNRDLMKSKAH